MPDHHGWNDRVPAGRIAYVNGRYLPLAHAGVHIEDRGLQLADSVYEVLRTVGGGLFDEGEHFDRLERSLGEIGMAMPMGRAALTLVIRELVRRNHVSDGMVYLQVTRGPVRRDHAIPKDSPRPTLILTARPVDRALVESRRVEGIKVVTQPDMRWGRCDIKSTALLPNVLAKTQGRRAGAYEVWLVNGAGEITEGASTTCWIVDAEGRLVTRPLGNDILPGVTRRVIFETAAAAQLPIEERAFTPAEAKAAREAFVSAATIGAMPVVEIDGVRIGTGKPGPVSRRIHELYERLAAQSTRNPGTDRLRVSQSQQITLC